MNHSTIRTISEVILFSVFLFAGVICIRNNQGSWAMFFGLIAGTYLERLLALTK